MSESLTSVCEQFLSLANQCFLLKEVGESLLAKEIEKELLLVKVQIADFLHIQKPDDLDDILNHLDLCIKFPIARELPSHELKSYAFQLAEVLIDTKLMNPKMS